MEVEMSPDEIAVRARQDDPELVGRHLLFSKYPLRPCDSV
jgi:hypothetical protein